MHNDPTGFLQFAVENDHNAARILEAYRWKIVEVSEGTVRLECHLPEHLLNVGGTLFGGFTPTYVDFIALWTVVSTLGRRRGWLNTVHMGLEYLEPLRPPGFRVHSRHVAVRKRDHLVETSFFTLDDDKLAAFAITKLRSPPDHVVRERLAADGDTELGG